MEGKEVRFGIANSSLWAVITTAASNGSVNSMHDSFTPLGGMIPLINIELGEVIYGGVGSGLYGMLLFVIIAVFVAGLMVGRTPEYLGKKIEAKEVKMAMLAILILPLSILGFTAVAAVIPFGGVLHRTMLARMASRRCSMPTCRRRATTARPSPASPATRCGTTSLAALRCWSAAISSSFRRWRSPARSPPKRSVPPSAGTFPTHGGLFVGLLVGVILIVGGLTFFPALALGPIVEHLAMTAGTLF